MLISVEHVTRYRYGSPVRGVVQSHRLTPSVFDGQAVREWEVSVTDGVRGARFRDGAGDLIESWSVMGPLNELEVRVHGVVETLDLAGMLRGHKEKVSPLCYLGDTLMTRADVAITELAESLREAGSQLDIAHALLASVSQAIVWRMGVTGHGTTAAEALARGEGVCQDHAHVMLSAARLLGMPARYVSGYMVGGGEGVGEAAHAWAELYIDGLGWIGFDAANCCCPDARYIRLGSGLDAGDAAPVRGTARGEGLETLEVSVAVVELAQ